MLADRRADAAGEMIAALAPIQARPAKIRPGERHGLSGGFLFDAIKNFVADLANGDKQSGGFADQDLRLATAALLVHAAAIDGTMSDIERDRLQSLLQQRFQLDDAAAGELIDQAAVADEKAVDLYHFTRLLNGSLDESERLRLIEMMWTIAYADGTASEFEDNLIWRVADLLGVSSTERIALRHRVAAQSGNRV